jgi:hypothetical protein
MLDFHCFEMCMFVLVNLYWSECLTDRTMSNKHDLWYTGILVLFHDLNDAAPHVIEIKRSLSFLETMDTSLFRRGLYKEALQHYETTKLIIESRSLQDAKSYLDAHGFGSYVASYYQNVVKCIQSLPSEINEACWVKLEAINEHCAPCPE